jgi:hypothetical protein
MRRLAAAARDEASRRELTEMANELEAEARKIDAEQSGPELRIPE